MSQPSSLTPSTSVSMNASDLHRTIGRSLNLVTDVTSSRTQRREGLKQMIDVLTPFKDKALGKKQVIVAPPKPALIFSAKAAAAAAAATPTPLAPTTVESKPIGPPQPLTSDQVEAINLLTEFVFTPIHVTGANHFIGVLIQRIADEMESIRSQTLDFTIELIDAIGSGTSAPRPYLTEFLPIIYARLAPSAAALSVAASFAASSSPSSTSLLHPSHSPLTSSTAAVTMQSGLAIPISSSAGNSLAPTLASAPSSGHLEPSEELRLKLLQLLIKLVEKEREKFLRLNQNESTRESASLEVIDSSMDKLVGIVLRTVNDAYPELKKESAQLITILSEVLGYGASTLTSTVRTDASNALQKSLLANLKHQHSQVRLQALQAFGSLIKHSGGESLSNTTIEALPILASILHDRTPKLREVFVIELQSWLQGLPNLLPIYQTRFLSLLLQLTGDEVLAIAQRAIEAINRVAAGIEQRNQMKIDHEEGKSETFLTSVAITAASTSTATTSGVSDSDSTWLPATLASPFPSRPPASARSFVASHLQDLLPAILGDLSDWTQTKRGRAAATLKSLLIYTEDAIIPHLVLVLQAIIKQVRDEESSIHILISQCAELLGACIKDSSIWMEWSLTELDKNADVNYRTSLLIVLCNLIKGMPILIQPTSSTSTASSTSNEDSTMGVAPSASKLDRLFPKLLETLANPDLCCSDDLAIRLQLHKILSCLLSRMPKSCGSKEFAEKLFHLLIQLDTKGVAGVGASATTTSTTSTAASSSTTTSQVVQVEEEKQLLTSLELLARCELQFGEFKLDLSNTSSSAPTSTALLSSVYCYHFLSELRTLFGAELLSNPQMAESLLPTGWGTSKDASHFTLLTFFQLLERGLGFCALETKATGNTSGNSICANLLESQFSLLMPLLVQSARPSNDSIPRSLTLNFLYKLVLLNQSSILRSVDSEFIRVIVQDIIVPNCVWKSGRVAASLRLHALTLTHAICINKLFTVPLALQVAPAIFPILKSNLDDDEPKVRMLVILILTHFLQLLPVRSIQMEEDSLTEFHRELLKRLDDSHDDIRLEVIQAFSLLFHRVFPPASDYDKTDSYYRYILSSFFIYLDDANPRVIDACYQFIQSTIDYNPRVFVQETEAAKKKQTTGRYCDQLLQLAQEKQQAK